MYKTAKTLFAGALVAVAGLGLAGSPASAADPITIATAGPMTGQYAAFGEQMRRGAEMAVADINAAGGVLGSQLKLEIGDDACDPRQAVAVANQFVNAGVVFVAGHFCSGSSIPASAVYNEEAILQMSPASTNPKLTEQGFPGVFRTCGRDDQQGEVAGDYIANNFKGKKVAVVHDKQAYSKGLADETAKRLEKNGFPITLSDTVTPGEQDYTALVTKLKAGGIEVLYYGGYHTEAGLIVRQMREQGMDTVLISGDALVTDEYWAITGDAGEGTLMTFSPDPARNAIAKPVVDRFLAQNYKPEGYTLYTYGAVQAWADAANKAGSTDLAAVAKVLKGNKFSTILGDIGFDSKGDVAAPGYIFYRWSNGSYNPI